MTATKRRAIRPQRGPQEAFLSSPADIAIYGGSAGGGKTWALLYEPLRHVANPHFGAVVFRRTSPQITNEGGAWDESAELYPLAGAAPYLGTLDWRFPSGANVGFRHLQHEDTKYDWQGAQVALLEFDELPHFSESQFFYMLSRNRSTCGVRPYVRATCNPDPGWVKRLLAPWVDKAFPGRPAASGELRHFVRRGGGLCWVDPGTPNAKSLTFVRSSVYDNRVLLERNPEYVANLEALPDVDRARLLHGDWDVRREGLVYPGFEACVVDIDGPPGGTRCGGIDFGFNNPFAALAAVLDHDDVLWVYWERYRSHCTLPAHSAALPPPGQMGRWYADPARPDSIAELRLAGHDVVPCLHLGQKPLLTGIDRVSERVRTGRLRVDRRCADLVRELGLYRYDPAKESEEPEDRDNHACDALRYLVTGIDRGRAVLGRPRPASEAERGAAALAEAAERERAHRDEWLCVTNPHFFPGADDD